MRNKEIGLMMGYTEPHVGLILRSPPAQEYLRARVLDLNGELNAQFVKVVRNMRDMLDSEDVGVKLRATDLWMKQAGKYAPKAARGEGPVSAEDVVAKLLEHAKNVQLNIDNRTQVVVNADAPPALDDDFSYLGGGQK